MHKFLAIAYHFPPAAVGSGHLRTLALTRYLPAHGWNPVVLSAHPRAYASCNERSLADIPDGVPVSRAFALDTRIHLGLGGRYPQLLAQPDRWVAWWLGAVPAGLRLIRRHRPSVIWSTFPIVTAHLIAYTLHRLTGIPWIADFRDPVEAADNGARSPQGGARFWVERRAVDHAARCVFTTPGTLAAYRQRYPGATQKFDVIANGYDEHSFLALGRVGSTQGTAAEKQITLVHSGALYRNGRDPTAFFEALAELRSRGALGPVPVRIVLRASSNDEAYRELVDSLGLNDMVEIAPAINYADALAEQSASDGLLIFQGSKYNRQIPAKVYEYLRVGRPIFALVDSAGDTAQLLESEQIDTMAPIDDAAQIAQALESFLDRLRGGNLPMPSPERVHSHSRQAGAARYARIFDEVFSMAAPGSSPQKEPTQSG